jgi:riboflavin biosynthesis pyrimidine reductase
VAQALLAAGAVDELQLVVAPAIGGTGRRLLDGVPATSFELIGSAVSPGGALLLGYRVVR